MTRQLTAHLQGYKRWIALCILLTALEVLCELIIPLLMAEIVDVGIPSGNLRYMAMIGAVMVGVAILAILLGVVNARFTSNVSQGCTASLRNALFSHVQTFSFSTIDRFSSASLITRMTSDITVLQNTLMMMLRMLTRAPIMLISAFVIAAGINFSLSLIIVVAIVLLLISTLVITHAVGKLFSEVQRRLDNLNGAVQENLIAIRVVKAFVREKVEREKFRQANDALTEASIHAGNIVSLTMPVMMLVLNVTTLAVIWFGGGFVGTGEMTTGQLMSFISYIMQILMSVMIFAMAFVVMTRARASVERIGEVLNAQPDITDPTAYDADNHRVTHGKVEFRHVSFRYASAGKQSRNALNDITFTANPGEFIGIIGGTGSGKTSLVNLIPRFYDVCDGEILIDGVDVREYKQNNLRNGIGMVMQKNNLFSGTIRDNLRWGKPDATDEEIIRAAKDAQAHTFISSFPDGYDTELGQGGVNVSGGQKQRLCIARAMLGQPPILILDDSTSAVDTDTEARIRASFHENFKDSTILIVAQRISSVKHADRILVLDDGQIAGMGTHEELLVSNAIYREICISQNELDEGGVA